MIFSAITIFLHYFISRTNLIPIAMPFNGKNYYFPEKWETNELSSLIKFFDLQDPFENTNKKGTLTSSAKANGGKGNRRMSTSLQVDFNGNVAGDAAGGEGKRRASSANRLSQSWGGGNNIGEGGGTIGGGGSRHGSITRSSLLGGLSSSITSSLKGGSQANLAKLLVSESKVT